MQKSLKDDDFFKTKKLVNLREMFDARVYLGHKEGTLNDHMKPYIFGSRLGHLVIDLDQSVELMREALNFAAHIAFRNGIILFVNKSTTVSLISLNCFNLIIAYLNSDWSYCRENCSQLWRV